MILLLSSTAPETNVIFKKLQADDRFKNTDLLNLYKNSPLPKKDNLAIKEFLDLIGKYDTETQIKYAQEFTGNFKTLKKQYQDYYNSHFKLYVISGLSVGIVICLMLI
ncbi:MAG: hypothetical protein PUE08_00630 [Eubacteriales bacterium]|nr:hypothetical protein [Eubacteriales bacterium]